MSTPALRILYVEDNEMLRETVGLLMEAEGREISTVGSAEEALGATRDQRFDLVVTDVSLPGLSGTDFARHLLAEAPDRWIVLCSGHELDATSSRLGRNVRVLSKPFDIERLDTLIQEAATALRS